MNRSVLLAPAALRTVHRAEASNHPALRPKLREVQRSLLRAYKHAQSTAPEDKVTCKRQPRETSGSGEKGFRQHSTHNQHISIMPKSFAPRSSRPPSKAMHSSTPKTKAMHKKKTSILQNHNPQPNILPRWGRKTPAAMLSLSGETNATIPMRVPLFIHRRG